MRSQERERCFGKPIASSSPDDLTPVGAVLRTGYSVLPSTRRCKRAVTLLRAKRNSPYSASSFLRTASALLESVTRRISRPFFAEGIEAR
jgi:hypothetical protein